MALPLRSSVFLAVIACASCQAHAKSIGINFGGGGNGSSPAITLAVTDFAGVVPQANFNNFTISTGTALALVDDSGAVIAAKLDFSSGGTYSSIAGAAITPAGGDEKLNTGFVYGNGSFTLSAIPYALYDVYVYELNDAAGRVETTTLGSTTYYGSSANPSDATHVDQNAGTSYSYLRTTSTDLANPTAGGNYVRFQNVSGASFTVTNSATGNGFVNGLQVVAVPEPASFALLGLSAAGLASMRRRRQA